MRFRSVLFILVTTSCGVFSWPPPPQLDVPPPDEATTHPAPAPAAEAPDVAGAQAVVQEMYAPYMAQNSRAAPGLEGRQDLVSSGLKTLLQSPPPPEDEGELGRITFDVVVNAQDYQVTDLQLSAEQTGHQQAKVIAKFKNFGNDVQVDWSLIVEDGSWKIDDIQSGDLAKDGWSVRQMLAKPVDASQSQSR